jgi:hypothetical protein
VPSPPDDWPAPGRYRHFKGPEYELLMVARDSETEEPVAVYRPLARPDSIWVRSLAMFVEQVDGPDGRVARFAYLGPVG